MDYTEVIFNISIGITWELSYPRESARVLDYQGAFPCREIIPPRRIPRLVGPRNKIEDRLRTRGRRRREKYDKSAANFSVSSSGTLLFSWQRIHTPPQARGGVVSGVQFASQPEKAAGRKKARVGIRKDRTSRESGTVLDARTLGCESSRLKISRVAVSAFRGGESRVLRRWSNRDQRVNQQIETFSLSAACLRRNFATCCSQRCRCITKPQHFLSSPVSLSIICGAAWPDDLLDFQNSEERRHVSQHSRNETF